MHAFKERLDPQKNDYTIQTAPNCNVCGGTSTAYGVECTEMHEVEPGDQIFHFVCSNCFSQLVICTDHVSFNITNIGYMSAGSGEMLYFCAESQYSKGTEYHVKGKNCDKDIYLNYLAKIRQIALANKDRHIADSHKYFHIEEEAVARPNFPLN